VHRAHAVQTNGFLYATAMVDDNSHRYSSGEMMYNSLFVWNTGKLIQTALDARQRSGDLSVPISELPARYDTPKSDSTPSNPQLFGWIYGQGAYSAQNVPKVYLHQVPALQALAPSIYDSSKAANPKVPAPPVKDTSNGTWNTFTQLVTAELLSMGSGIVASAQSLFGFDNSTMIAQMDASQKVIDTLGFDTSGGSGWSQIGAGSAKMVNDIFAGFTQINTNVAGYYFRAVAGLQNVLTGRTAEMPAPTTPFLQYVDSGTSVAQQAGYVGRVAIESLVDAGGAFYKMGANLLEGAVALYRMDDALAQEKMNNARDSGFEALTMLLGAKLGETMLDWRKIALKTKQMVFDIEAATQGIINKSVKVFQESVQATKRVAGDAVGTIRTVILKEKTIPSNDPALPPVKVTEVLTPEQVVAETAGDLYMTPNGQTIKNSCFHGETLVYIKDVEGGGHPRNTIHKGWR
jgi:hypothetical protein